MRIISVVVIINALDKIFTVLGIRSSIGVVITGLRQGDIHDVLVGGDKHLFGADQARLGGLDPTNFRHLDDAHGFFAVASHHVDDTGAGLDHWNLHSNQSVPTVHQGGFGL